MEVKDNKVEKFRTRLTVGGNTIDYPDEVATKTADMTTVKLLLNSTISTSGARFSTADIGNFYLGTPMDRYEYIVIPLDIIPEAIINQYNMRDMAYRGKVYAEVRKGMYGLPQAGVLANKQLAANLKPHGYYQCVYTPGLWRHQWRPVSFSLVVDDFGVKYKGREHAQHLFDTLRTYYEKITVGWAGSLYCGVQLKWDYINRSVDLSMPDYVTDMLHKYQHQRPENAQHSPAMCQVPKYGSKQIEAEAPDETEQLSERQAKYVQQVVGTLIIIIIKSNLIVLLLQYVTTHTV